MTTDEAIVYLKGIKDWIVITCENNHENLTDAIDMAIDALKREKWIPCSERMPDVDTEKDSCWEIKTVKALNQHWKVLNGDA
jgi:hypothetical protein